MILVFNLALAYHLQAIEGSAEKNPCGIRKARSLYELALGMQVESGIVLLNVSQTLAIINNCGQIYRLLKRKRRAENTMRSFAKKIAMVKVLQMAKALQIKAFVRDRPTPSLPFFRPA